MIRLACDDISAHIEMGNMVCQNKGPHMYHDAVIYILAIELLYKVCLFLICAKLYCAKFYMTILICNLSSYNKYFNDGNIY